MTASVSATSLSATGGSVQRAPRLGFIGTGWIGRLRMAALAAAQQTEFAAVYDPSSEAAEAAAAIAPGARVFSSIEHLLDEDLDGVVIATPSALHAAQCEQALRAGKAVFCQKPLARTKAETERVIDAARAADKLLAVDFSYRYLAGVDRLRELVTSGALGDIFAADLVFHNAYGPDKPWFYDVASSGGGSVMDLGVHLVDLILWLLPNAEPGPVQSRLFRNGHTLEPPFAEVEDFARAEFAVGDTEVRLCCSWNLHAGCDAIIEVTLQGTQGGVAIRNVAGSFFDFEIHHFRGTARHKLAGYPDSWGGRALSAWAEKLQYHPNYDSEVEQVIRVAEVIDRIYRR